MQGLLDDALGGYDDDSDDGEFIPYKNDDQERAQGSEIKVGNEKNGGAALMFSASEGLTDMGESPVKIEEHDVSPDLTNGRTDQNSSKSPISGLLGRKNYYDPHEPHSA